MKITWIGHSCFRLESAGFSIIIDPYSDKSVPGLENVRECANSVFLTHFHSDHNFTDGVKLIPPEGDGIFTVKKVRSFHDEERGKKRGENSILIISDGKFKVAHLGDLGSIPEDVSPLFSLDAVLVPVGGFYTIDGNTAAKLVEMIRPRCAVPMHFRDDSLDFGLEEISTSRDFLSHFDEIDYKGSSSFSLEEVEDGHIVVLKPKNLKR